jgi:uncharacterized protein (TIGR02118 family)
MNQIVLFIKRKPGMSFEAFREHYESVHVPIAERGMGPWLTGYRRSYLVPVPGRPEPLYDCVTELSFRDRQAMEAAMAWGGSEAGQVLSHDEENFMDRPARVASMADTVESKF